MLQATWIGLCVFMSVMNIFFAPCSSCTFELPLMDWAPAAGGASKCKALFHIVIPPADSRCFRSKLGVSAHLLGRGSCSLESTASLVTPAQSMLDIACEHQHPRHCFIGKEQEPGPSREGSGFGSWWHCWLATGGPVCHLHPTITVAGVGGSKVEQCLISCLLSKCQTVFLYHRC